MRNAGLIIGCLIIMIFPSGSASASSADREIATREIEAIDQFGGLDVPEVQMFDHPVDLTVGPDGRISVLDSRAGNIKIFSAEGEYLRTISREGSGPGEFKRPWIIQSLADHDLAVADCGNGRVQILSDDGEYREGFKVPISYGSGMAFDEAGNLCVNSGAFRSQTAVVIYCRDGEDPRRFGELEGKIFDYYDFTLIRKQIKDGRIPETGKDEFTPAVDLEGRILAVYRWQRKLKLFSPEGRLLRTIPLQAPECDEIERAFREENRKLSNRPNVYTPLRYVQDAVADGQGRWYVLLKVPDRMTIYVFDHEGEFQCRLLGVEDEISRVALDETRESVQIIALGSESHLIYRLSLGVRHL